MQVVFQRPADKIFNGKIINALGVDFVVPGNRFIHLVHGKFANSQSNGVQGFVFVDFAGALADKILDVMLD